MTPQEKINQLQIFLDLFPQKIRERAHQYFIKSLVQITNSGYREIYQAYVYGGQRYEVFVNLANGEFNCTCPAQKPCKHIGALLYQILDDLSQKEAEGSCDLAICINDFGSIQLSLILPNGQLKPLESANMFQLKEPVRDFLEKKNFSFPKQVDVKKFILKHIAELATLPNVTILHTQHSEPLSYGGKQEVKQIWKEKVDTNTEAYPDGFRQVIYQPYYVFTLPTGESYEFSIYLSPAGNFWVSPDKPVLYHIFTQKEECKYQFSCDLNTIARHPNHPLYPKYEYALKNMISHGPQLLLSLYDIEERVNKRGVTKNFLLASVEIAYAVNPDDFLNPKSPLYTISIKAGNHELALYSQRFSLVEHKTGKILKRDLVKETELYQKFLKFKFPENGRLAVYRGRWDEFFQNILPRVKKAGVIVRIDEKVLGVVNKPMGILKIKPGSGIDWFSGQIVSEELQGDELHQFWLAVRRKDELIRLKNGRWVSVEGSGLAELLRSLSGYGVTIDEEGNIKNLSLATVAALELERQANLRTEEGAKGAMKKIRRFFQEPIGKENPDPKFRGKLRPYQLVGMRFLLKLYQAQVGGVLADDMGLGKTIQAIAAMSFIKDKWQKKPRFLVICPVSALSVWEGEINRFAPHIIACRWHGSSRDKNSLKDSHLVLTSYGTFLRNHKILCKNIWDVVFVDEAQVVKNQDTRIAKAIRKVKANSIICLTGTPLENSLEELWAIFDLVFPGYLGTKKYFKEEFGSRFNVTDSQRLKKLISPFLLRRRKIDVLKELPEKEEMIIKVPMTKEQIKVYQAAYLKALEIVKNETTPIIEMLKQLLILRQIALHPYLEDANPDPTMSGKIVHLMEILDEIYSSSRGVLIFSQFLKPLKILQNILKERNIEFFYLDGQTTQRERQEMVKSFQEGDVKFFLISLRAGGTALTLTKADTVIHLDPWWNPAVENQATDRAHRIGQDRKVMVYKLISEGTIEEKVLLLQEKKRKLYEILIDDIRNIKKISREDILELLSKNPT